MMFPINVLTFLCETWQMVSEKREEIEALYGRYNSEKIQEVGALLGKYGEDKLLAMVRSGWAPPTSIRPPAAFVARALAQGAPRSERATCPTNLHCKFCWRGGGGGRCGRSTQRRSATASSP
jgi:hypothetical protein